MLQPSQMFLNSPQNAVSACPGVGFKADYLRLLLAPGCHSLADLISLVSDKATWSPPPPQSSNSWVLRLHRATSATRSFSFGERRSSPSLGGH